MDDLKAFLASGLILIVQTITRICFSNFIVWESEQWTRHLILKRISEYVLVRHLSVTKENIVHVVDQLDFSLLHGVNGNAIGHKLLVVFVSFLPCSFQCW